MDVRIRRATVNDAAVVALLGRATFSETFGELFVSHKQELNDYLDYTFAIAKIRQSLDQSDNHFWVAYANELPVGYAKLKLPSETPLLEQPSSAQLQKIYVLRDHLAHGIGASLLQTVCDCAASLRVPTIWLTVLTENALAIRFYKKHGFEKLGYDTFTIGSQTFDFVVLMISMSR